MIEYHKIPGAHQLISRQILPIPLEEAWTFYTDYSLKSRCKKYLSTVMKN